MWVLRDLETTKGSPTAFRGKTIRIVVTIKQGSIDNGILSSSQMDQGCVRMYVIEKLGNIQLLGYFFVSLIFTIIRWP